MNKTIRRKTLRELWMNLSRTLLIIFAIALGVSGVGFVADAGSILSYNIDQNYKSVNPASGYVWLERVDDNALKTAASFPGVLNADYARLPIRARVEVKPGRWEILLLYVIDDFSKLQVGKFFPEAGSFSPGKGQVLIERSSMEMVRGEIGKTINVKVLNSDAHEIKITGTVFDPSPDPAWVSDIAVGYINPDTLQLLGGAAPLQGLQIKVRTDRPDRAEILKITNSLAADLGTQGYKVLRVEVPIPGKYQQTDKINSILATLAIFGALSLLLSGIITALLISSLMTQQIRQIGVMKAVGANSKQILSAYMGMVFSMAAPALVLGMIIGYSVARGFAVSTLDMLNFNVFSSGLQIGAIVAQIVLGLIIPASAAFFPLRRGSKITVLDAISDYGVDTKDFGRGRLDDVLVKIKMLPRLLLLSLRNTFRKRGRLILSLSMLAIGGAAFISSIGASASWNKSIDQSFKNINYDIDIRLAKQYPAEQIEKSLLSLKGVKSAEAWGYTMASAYPKYKDGTYGPSYAVFAPKNGSAMINPPVVSGRWLKENDLNAVVVDTDFIDNAEKLGMPIHVGDDLVLNLSGKDVSFKIVGIMDKIGTQSAAYVNYNYFSKATGQSGNAMCARIILDDKTQVDPMTLFIDQKLTQDGINIFAIQPLTVSRQIMANHVVLILSLLLLMAVLTALVGALGLAAGIGLNVMERSREFGIMRSIGATSGTIIKSVIAEGILIGLISWLLGVILSIPLTSFIALNTGGFIFPHIMYITYPMWAPLLWLGIVVIVSVTASLAPALKASKLTIREVLNYQ